MLFSIFKNFLEFFSFNHCLSFLKPIFLLSLKIKKTIRFIVAALLCFALLCFALLCFALLWFILVCFQEILVFSRLFSASYFFALLYPSSSLFFFALLLRSSSPEGGCEPKGDANRRGMRTKAATSKEVVIQRDANQRARKGEGMRTEGIPVFSLLP